MKGLEGALLFNKLEYDDDSRGGDRTDNRKAGKPRRELLPKDPRQALAVVEKRRENLERLRSKDPEKAKEAEDRDAWAKAIQKAQGVVIHDDVKMLKKSIARRDAEKKKGKEQWAKREKQTKESTHGRAMKRKEHLDARKEKKKNSKKHTDCK